MLSLVLLFSLVGCTYDNSDFASPTISPIDEDTKETVPENKEELTDEGNKPLWNMKEYVDEFEISTGEKYISSGTLTGQFSNTATTNSKLSVKILVDKDFIAIMLYEYGNQQVKNISSRNGVEYSITIRQEDDTRSSISGEMPPGGDRIVIKQNEKYKLLKLLYEDSDLIVHIVNNDRTTTTYLFDVSISNFTELYDDTGWYK